jgi:hypothetical protein
MIHWNKPIEIKVWGDRDRYPTDGWVDAKVIYEHPSMGKQVRYRSKDGVHHDWCATTDGLIDGCEGTFGEVRNKPEITANFTLSEMPIRAKEDFDPIQKPSHYSEGRKYETIDVIEDWSLGYHLSNALKYLSRYNRKGDGIQDLKKAIWYIQRKIKLEEK